MGKMNLFVDHLRICLDIYCLLSVNVKPYSFSTFFAFSLGVGQMTDNSLAIHNEGLFLGTCPTR